MSRDDGGGSGTRPRSRSRARARSGSGSGSSGRSRLVAICAWTYPTVWAAAGAIGLAFGVIANSTWAAGQDTGGLGAMLAAFFVSAALGNLVWGIVAVEYLADHGRPMRSLLVAAGIPLLVIAVWIAARPAYGIVCAVVAPAPLAWWATSPRRSMPLSSER